MNCNDCQHELLQGGVAVGSDAERHLDTCRDCRQFAQLVDMISPGAAPTPELDRQTLAAATLHLRRHRLARSFRLAAAAAAILVLAAAAALTLHLRPDPQPTLLAGVSERLQTEHWMVAWADADSEIDNLELQLAVVTAGL